MAQSTLPAEIPNWINGEERFARSGEFFDKLDPTNGKRLCRVARSRAEDVEEAVLAARHAQPAWAGLPATKRGEVLHDLALGLRQNRESVARVVAAETGKSPSAALDEADGAVALGFFMAGEGQRLYGRTMPSGVPNRSAMTIRQPVGVAGLITAANTPIANVAWKVFPALICGNAAVLKPPEDAPATAWIFGQIARQSGLPAGVLNVLQGLGEEAGAPLVAHAEVDVISFTGSTEVGRQIAVVAGQRLAKVSLELGGKNPLVVCDDADLENAVHWVLLSAFSNAGQRCASGSRIIVFDAVYDEFRNKLVERTARLKVGPGDNDDFGPVINEAQLNNMLQGVEQVRQRGASVAVGGNRLDGPQHREGYYMAPTILEKVGLDDELSRAELFGPITCLYRVGNYAEALQMANQSPYGLTACIHTRSLSRAMSFCREVQAGVAVVNAGTFGSEPHMPFGGVKQSGNGWREPGTEALDVYSELKDVYISIAPNEL